MPEQPRDLAASEWGTNFYHPGWATLELRCGQKNRLIRDDGSEQTLHILGDQGLNVRFRYVIVDTTEFFHTFGEGTLACRSEWISPLDNRAGVERVAFPATSAMPGTVQKGAEHAPGETAALPPGRSETRERMYVWPTSEQSGMPQQRPA